jgi:hypothetical protein
MVLSRFILQGTYKQVMQPLGFMGIVTSELFLFSLSKNVKIGCNPPTVLYSGSYLM